VASRVYGSGSVTETAPGVFKLRVRVPRDPVTGKDRINETFRGTKKAAGNRLAEMIVEHGRADAGRNRSEMTLAEIVTQYFDKTPLARGTAANFRRAWTLVPPDFARRKAVEIDTSDIDGLYARLVEKGESVHTRAHLHTLLRAAFNKQIKWARMRFNPCTVATAPVAPEVMIDVLTADQMRNLTEVMVGDLEMSLFLRVSMVTGSRRGEALGIRWSDLDTESNTVKFADTVDEAGRVKATTKTRKERKVPLDQGTLRLFAEWRTVQASRAAAVGDVVVEDPWVFSRDRNGERPMTGRVAYERFTKHAERAGIRDATPKMMRNCMISYALDSGEDVFVVSKIVGHARTSTTQDIYRRMVTGADRRAMDRIGELMPLGERGGSVSALPKRRVLGAGGVSPFDDPVLLAEVIAAHGSRMAILEALGLSAAAKNYNRLEQRAEAFGLTLPAKARNTRAC
jgi:integrase